MTSLSGYFQQFHAPPLKWLDLFEELSHARSELPQNEFQPTVIFRENESREESIRRSVRELFHPVSTEVFGAAGERFQEGQWPAKLSSESVYFLRIIITFAMQTVGSIAPLPERPLKPTLIPFPNAPVTVVALWFATEWWLTTGGQLYEAKMCEPKNKEE